MLGIGLISTPLAWTASPDLALTAVILVDVEDHPVHGAADPGRLADAAHRLLRGGAGRWHSPGQSVLQVTLPLIKPALMVAVIFRLLDALRIFDLIYVLTSNSKDTMSMSVCAASSWWTSSGGLRLGGLDAAVLTVALCTVLYITFGRVRFDGR